MPKVHSVAKARKDILTYEGENKLSKKQKLSEDDYIVKKGEPYFWWKFRRGGKQISKTYPKRSQLTQSGFLSSLYDLQDRISNFTCDSKDDFESFKSEIVDEINSMKDECESSLQNMPEHLQESSSSGQMLQERIDALDNWASEIESIECNSDEGDEDFETDLQSAVEDIQNSDSGL